MDRNGNRLVTALLLWSSVVLLAGCAAGARRETIHPGRSAATASPAVTAHAGPTDRESFYAIPDTGHGSAQSPVNIVRAGTVEAHHEAAVRYAHAAASCVKNQGHTVEVEFPAGSFLEYDGTRYELVQLHFHTPSEHQLDGITFPMEMHIVHVRAPRSPTAPPEYLVVGVLFRMGTANAFIDGFLDAVPPEGGRRVDLQPARVFIDELFPGATLPAHFHYRGSLTTPPYTETVEWLVLEQHLDASPAQIGRINTLEGNNARHVQALAPRRVEAAH